MDSKGLFKEQVEQVIEILNDLSLDINVSKNIKIKIQHILDLLNERTEFSIRINKVLTELDSMSNDPNLEAYTRTQIWNVVSILEKLNQ